MTLCHPTALRPLHVVAGSVGKAGVVSAVGKWAVLRLPDQRTKTCPHRVELSTLYLPWRTGKGPGDRVSSSVRGASASCSAVDSLSFLARPTSYYCPGSVVGVGRTIFHSTSCSVLVPLSTSCQSALIGLTGVAVRGPGTRTSTAVRFDRRPRSSVLPYL